MDSKIRVYLIGVTLLLLFVRMVRGSGIGDRLLNTYGIYNALPLTLNAAVNAGWQQYTDGCDTNIGTGYSAPSLLVPTPSTVKPIILYYTAGGQISGIGVVHYGRAIDGPNPDFWMPTDSYYQYYMTVSFRSASSDICDDSVQYDELIGTQAVINQGGVSFNIPRNIDEAAAQNWFKGGCIADMGVHWSYDLEDAPEMSWHATNLLPVIAVYNQATGRLSAFFLTTPILQTSIIGVWEGPFPNPIMCQNWCDIACNFESWILNTWSTLHFFLTDHNLNTCEHGILSLDQGRCNNTR